MVAKSALLVLSLLACVHATTKFIPAVEDLEDDKTCYIDPVFDKDDIQITRDIQYGSSWNGKTNSTQLLMLDAYLPPDSDTRESKPTIVFIHGGGFTDGDKSAANDMAFVMELCIRGYAAVSINYRLTGEFYPWDTERAVLDAQEDARAAVRFIRSQAGDYNLDTERIVIMGESAGAYTSLYVGYAKNA